MKEIQYRKFSWDTHTNNWKLKRPNVCQFELTFKCGLNCNYCYTSCYNKSGKVKEVAMKYYSILILALMTACSPSAQTIQAALIQTQNALGTATGMV
ncbi:MAG: hypothetical protein NTW06_03850, partial [Candidatus Falkowbacteria bacterium]|nr:hypothetical protein [Candidatus Falkowbacteria bacterium]